MLPTAIPVELMLSKIWANGLVIAAVAVLSLIIVVEGIMGIPVAGSIGLFAMGTAVYLFAVTSLGIVLSAVATTMPQFGLLSIPVFVVMKLLSGGMTPLESMPEALQIIMRGAPSTHFIKFSEAVLCRSSGLEIVWPPLAATIPVGAAFFGFALSRFRKTMEAAR